MNFKELYDLPLDGLTENRNGYTYLPWLECLKLVNEHIGSCSYTAGNTEYHPMSDGKHTCTVSVKVNISGAEYGISYPVADGDQPIVNPNAMQVHWAQQRAFVKCVAISTGLGLKLWEKNDPDKAEIPKTDHRVEILKLIGELVPRFGDAKATYKELGYTSKQLQELMKNPGKEQEELLVKLQSYFQDDI